jgi:uncharacterized protein (TIGR02679 family)
MDRPSPVVGPAVEDVLEPTAGEGHSEATTGEIRKWLSERPALCEVLRLAEKKLMSLDTVRGALTLSDFRHRDAVFSLHARLTGRPAHTLKMVELDRAFRATTFQVSLRAAIEIVAGRPLVTKADQAALRAAAATRLHDRAREAARRLGDDVAGGAAAVSAFETWWSSETPSLNTMAQSNASAATVELVAGAVGLLAALASHAGARPVSVPELALRAGGHPHLLDVDTPGGRLLDRVLARLAPPELQATGVANAENRAALYAEFNLVVDELSSTVAVFGLSGDHEVLGAAVQRQAVVVLPLLTVDELGALHVSGVRIYAVENPAVFMAITRELRARRLARMPAVICTSGQLSVAARRLLGSAIAQGATIWYSGDYDSHGCAIASGLHRQWPHAIVPWRWTPADVTLARATTPRAVRRDATLSPTPDDFANAITAVQSEIAAGGTAFQEGMIPALVDDVVEYAESLA